MTIAEAGVLLKLALPQGWTKEDIEYELNDILTALQDRLQTERNWVLEFEVGVGHVDADPFINSKLRQLPNRLPVPLAMR